MTSKLETRILKFEVKEKALNDKAYLVLLNSPPHRMFQLETKNFKEALGQAYDFLIRSCDESKQLKVETTEKFSGEQQAEIISKFTKYSQIKNVLVQYYFR